MNQNGKMVGELKIEQSVLENGVTWEVMPFSCFSMQETVDGAEAVNAEKDRKRHIGVV